MPGDNNDDFGWYYGQGYLIPPAYGSGNKLILHGVKGEIAHAKHHGKIGNHEKPLPTSSDIISLNDPWKVPDISQFHVKQINAKCNAASILSLVK